MTAQELRDARRTDPFVPFNLRMVGGRIFRVLQPDRLAILPNGRSALVYSEDDSSTQFDPFDVTAIEWLSSPAAQP